MPKAPPKNGYFYFMQTFRDREQRAGRHFRGMNEVAQAASPEWQSLSQQERDDYNAYAKEQRAFEERKNIQKKPKPLEKKYNSDGKNLAVLKREQEEKKKYEEEVRKFVERFIQTKTAEELKSEVLHLIHVNYFCKTDDEEKTYYPAELAISKFSIKEGLIDSFHTFMTPGDIKKGYMYAVKERSEKFHKITLAHVQQIPNSSDYVKIFDGICKFLELDKNVNKSVPLFTMPDDAFHNTSFIAVEKTLEGLWQSKHSAPNLNEWKKFFPVYPLHFLLYQLKNAGFRYSKNEPIGVEEKEEENRALPNASLAAVELHKDTYNMKDDYSCEFHVEQDAVAHCSLSFVSRWAQIMRDHCCHFFQIDLAGPAELNDLSSECDYRSAASFGTRAPSYAPSYAPSVTPSRPNTSYKEDEDDDAFADCQSMVSGYSVRTNTTCRTEESVGFLPDESDRAGLSSKSSHISKGSSVWHGGRGRALRAAAPVAPSIDDENFPTLGGINRGLRRVNLK